MENGRWAPEFRFFKLNSLADSGGYMGDLVFNGGNRRTLNFNLRSRSYMYADSQESLVFGVEINSKSCTE